MYKFMTAIILTLAVLILGSCTTSSGSDKWDGTVMEIDGRKVKAEELFRSTAMRQGLQQFLVSDQVTRMAIKEGIEIDRDAIDAQMENLEQTALSQGMSMEEFLASQHVSMDDLVKTYELQQYFDKLIKSRVEVTEEDMQAVWDERADEIKYRHATENHLTEAEREALTFEDVREDIDELIRADRAGETGRELLDEMRENMSLKILVFDDPKESERYADLIMGRDSQTDSSGQAPESQDSMGSAPVDDEGAEADVPADAEPVESGEPETNEAEEDMPAEGEGH